MAKARIQKYLDAAPLLQCPLCGGPLAEQDPALRCPKGHSYVISSKGFVTFAGNCTPLKGYDTAFFEARSRVLQTGLYSPVLEALVDILAAHGATGPILDAGCGEGYYAKGVKDAIRTTVLGLDYAKDAIRCAARGANDVLWLVADLAHMPLANHSLQAVLNVFTPANYAEFERVLAPNGLLIKVVPGSDHMRELRQLAKSQLRHVDYCNSKIVDYFDQHVCMLDRIRVGNTKDVLPHQVEDVLTMSPVSFDVDGGRIDLDQLDQITVDAEILVGTFRSPDRA